MIVREEEINWHEGETDASGKALTIKEMDSDLQPREKALRLGLGSLSLPELLALVLRTGMPGRPVTLICRELMRDNDHRLHELEKRTRQELTLTPGIGPTKALQIEALLELVRRYNLEAPPERPRIRTSADAYAVMAPRIGNLDHEEVWVMLLNKQNCVVRISRISSGGLAASIFDVRMVMKMAITESCSSLILCHNHPSGNLTPSPQDDAITRKCADACRVFDINMLDHIIVTSHSMYSYRDKDRMPR